MRSDTFITIYFLFSVFSLILFCGVIYYYDPLKIFHKPYVCAEYLQKNMRQQAAGIINNWDFNSVILGTSMLENTSSQEASQIFGGKFINISLSGSDFWERGIVLNYVLRKKPIKMILYSLDYFGLVDGKKGTKNYPLYLYDYLYDKNPFNDIKVYLNRKYLKNIFFKKDERCCLGEKVDPGRPNAWFGVRGYAEMFDGISGWIKSRSDLLITSSLVEIVRVSKKIKRGEVVMDKDVKEKIKNSEKYLNETIIDYARRYPKTTFILIVPPYSRMKNAINAQYNKPRFFRVKEAIRYLVDMSSRVKNIKVYGWGDSDYPDDISHYKDLEHYHHSFNSLMLQYIKNNEGLLTNDNVDAYLNSFTWKSVNYDFLSVGRFIEDAFKK